MIDYLRSRLDTVFGLSDFDSEILKKYLNHTTKYFGKYYHINRLYYKYVLDPNYEITPDDIYPITGMLTNYRVKLTLDEYSGHYTTYIGHITKGKDYHPPFYSLLYVMPDKEATVLFGESAFLLICITTGLKLGLISNFDVIIKDMKPITASTLIHMIIIFKCDVCPDLLTKLLSKICSWTASMVNSWPIDLIILKEGSDEINNIMFQVYRAEIPNMINKYHHIISEQRLNQLKSVI